MHKRLALPLACLACASLVGCKEQIVGLQGLNPYKDLQQNSGLPQESVDEVYPNIGETWNSSGTGTAASMTGVFTTQPKLLERPTVTDLIRELSNTTSFTSRDGFDTKNVGGTPAVGIELVRVGTGVKLHSQSHEYHALYIISGRATVTLDGTGAELRAGHFITIPSGTTYRIKRTGEQPVNMLKISEPPASPADSIWLE